MTTATPLSVESVAVTARATRGILLVFREFVRLAESPRADATDGTRIVRVRIFTSRLLVHASDESDLEREGRFAEFDARNPALRSGHRFGRADSDDPVHCTWP